jgi:hypothetical protein
MGRETFGLAALVLFLTACAGDDASGTAGPDAAPSGGGTGPSGGSSAGGSGGTSAGGSGGTQDASSDATSCDGVTCSNHGTCSIASGVAVCSCDTGYHANGTSCDADQSCTGVDCGACGQCKVVSGVATCECPTGYVLSGSKCLLSPDPCDTTTCASDEACVSEAHCQPLGACVKTCDCSNCGNCGPDNSDGRWDDWQEYCGNLKSSPATMACNKPCPSGEGCLPYATPICWPIEGCFSL